MLIDAEVVEKTFFIGEDEEDPFIVKQVKVTTSHPEVFLDPDQVTDLIHKLESTLTEINGE